MAKRSGGHRRIPEPRHVITIGGGVRGGVIGVSRRGGSQLPAESHMPSDVPREQADYDGSTLAASPAPDEWKRGKFRDSGTLSTPSRPEEPWHELSFMEAVHLADQRFSPQK